MGWGREAVNRLFFGFCSLSCFIQFGGEEGERRKHSAFLLVLTLSPSTRPRRLYWHL